MNERSSRVRSDQARPLSGPSSFHPLLGLLLALGFAAALFAAFGMRLAPWQHRWIIRGVMIASGLLITGLGLHWAWQRIQFIRTHREACAAGGFAPATEEQRQEFLRAALSVYGAGKASGVFVKDEGGRTVLIGHLSHRSKAKGSKTHWFPTHAWIYGPSACELRIHQRLLPDPTTDSSLRAHLVGLCDRYYIEGLPPEQASDFLGPELLEWLRTQENLLLNIGPTRTQLVLNTEFFLRSEDYPVLFEGIQLVVRALNRQSSRA